MVEAEEDSNNTPLGETSTEETPLLSLGGDRGDAALLARSPSER